MAVAGCYGGPTFNILIGLGVSLSYICYRNYPQQSSFELDYSAYISIVYTLVALTLSIIFTVRHQFRINAMLGYMLVSIYILYTVTETAVALLILS
jgi:sodium/potassium/calcium exchanger 6